MAAYPRGRTWGRRLSWLAVLSLTVAAFIAPQSVSAHNLKVSLTCEDGLVVNLTKYSTTNGHTNSVAVSIDGTPVAGSPFTFGKDFVQTFVVAPPTVPHTAVVAVTAWDDPSGSHGWTKTFNLSIDACAEPTPTPTPADPTPTATPPEPTPTPTGEVGGETATPTPAGGVGGATATPPPLPRTDAIDGSGSGLAGEGWRLVLLAMAGLLAAVLVLTPAKAVVRKDDPSR